MTKHLLWQASSVLIGALVFFPLITLVWLSFTGSTEVLSHLASTVLYDYIASSLQLMAGVAILTLVLGIGSAWLVTQYSFTGSRFFNWALLLPLAMPTYITAYSYTGLLEIAGPVQAFIRETFTLQFGEYWFPEIRSIGGAIFVMSFVLYPYVYLLARASFIEQSQYLRDAGQLLGLSRRQAFFKITLPIARPAIVAGVSLALMETLADYGAVDYFGVSTFTTGIFRTWDGLDSVSGAAQLALMLLMFVIVLMVVEKHSRKRRHFYDKSRGRKTQIRKLSGFKQAIAITLACVPLFLGFIIPVSQLLIWAIQTHTQLFEATFWSLVTNTLLLAGLTSIIAVILAVLVAYAHRVVNNALTLSAKQIVKLGYALPGTIIAIGTLIPLARLDNQIDAWFRSHLDFSTGLLITGSIGALVIAYLVRFLAVSLNTVDSGLSGIASNMDQAARSLGLSPMRVIRRVHIPMLRASLLTALLIVFVDVMKELPATLILRPLNFNTLAVRAYELASDERLADASMASIAIVLVGLIPVIFLTKGITQQKDK